MSDWSSTDNAAAYNEFTRAHLLFQQTSRDLVKLAGLNDPELVVDLACGTGITTEEILASVDEHCRVIAIDRSAAMLAVARERVRDPRVTWVEARAAEVSAHAAQADAIICNAAIWQVDIEPTVSAAAATLKSDAALVFNIRSPLVTMPCDSSPPTGPPKQTLLSLIQALAEDEQRRRPGHCSVGGPRVWPMASQRIEQMLTNAGLRLDATRIFSYENRPDTLLALFKVPVFADGALPDTPYSEQLRIIEAAYARFDKTGSAESRWIAFRARKL
jgi:ubiquinone/menaquinone biosynthesis C-methylase UbiE